MTSVVTGLILTFGLLSRAQSVKLDDSIAVDDGTNCKRPVLAVGAGPTGLTLATVLRRYDNPGRLIEKKPTMSRHTKATNLMQRNQEFLFALGLLEPLQQVSGAMRRIMVHVYGKNFEPRTICLHEIPFTDVLLCG